MMNDLDYPTNYPNDNQRGILGALASKNESMFQEMMLRIPYKTGVFYQGLSLMQLAAKHDYVRGVEILMEHGVSPDDKGHENELSALDYAVLNNSYEMVKLLLDRGANPNNSFTYYPDPAGPMMKKCTLGLALEEDAPHIVQLLLEKGANPNAVHAGEPLIVMAGKRCHASIAELLCLHQANVNAQDKDGNTVLHICALTNKEKLTTLLLKKYHADACIRNNNQDMAMHLAVNGKNTRILSMLQQHGTPIFEPNCGGESVVSLVVNKNDSKLLHTLFDHWLREFSFTNRKEWRLNKYLTMAVSGGHSISVDYLIKHVSDFNEADASGKTALHHAAQYGLDMFNQFIPYLDKCDINKQDAQGNTALHYAVLKWHVSSPKIVKTLIERGADPDICNNKGETISHIAFFKGDRCEKYLEAVLEETQKNRHGKAVLITHHQSGQNINNRGDENQNG